MYYAVSRHCKYHRRQSIIAGSNIEAKETAILKQILFYALPQTLTI
jgi:hypothetical protein